MVVIFLHSQTIEILDRSQFSKEKFGWVRRAQKVRKIPQKWGFWQKSNPFRCAFFSFLVQYKSSNGLLTFYKNSMFRKNLLLELLAKNQTFRPIRVQNSLNYNISQMSWGMKLNFWMWNVTRGPWAQQILVGCLNWVWSGTPGHVHSDGK